MVPLLPKLRGQFAEFLNQRFPERLRLRAPPTCVSFSTVAVVWAFLGYASGGFVNKCTRPCGTGISNTPTPIHTTSSVRGAGILTCFPSSTPFGLD